MFNEISDDVFTLEDWKPEWTLAEVYEVNYKNSNLKKNTFFIQID